MNLVLDWFNGLSRGWWEYVVQSSWQAAVVGSVVLLVVQCLGRRWPAPLRYALLVLALLKFACPPLLPVPTGLFSQFAGDPFVLHAQAERKPTVAPASRAANAAAKLGAGGLASTAELSRTSPINWTVWLMIVHALGTAAVAAWIFRQALRLRSVSRAGQVKLGETLGVEYRDLAIELGVYQIPPLAISDQVAAPMAFGVKKSAIMLPTRIVSRLSRAELRTVLAHELAHCQRGDLWLNWVQLVLLALWWFHPVAWLIHRSLQDVREDCCDDLLLSRGLVSNDAYCDVLLRAAEELCPEARLTSGLTLIDRIHPLARRLIRITDWTVQRRESVSSAGALAVLVVAALLLPGAKPLDNAASAAPSVSSSAARMLAQATPVKASASGSNARGAPVRPVRRSSFVPAVRAAGPLPRGEATVAQTALLAPRPGQRAVAVNTPSSGMFVQTSAAVSVASPTRVGQSTGSLVFGSSVRPPTVLRLGPYEVPPVNEPALGPGTARVGLRRVPTAARWTVWR